MQRQKDDLLPDLKEFTFLGDDTELSDTNKCYNRRIYCEIPGKEWDKGKRKAA